MKRISIRPFLISCALLLSFALFTLAVSAIDVRPVGPLASPVGFASLNAAFHRLTGVHLSLYLLTDALSLLPLCLAASFALLGLHQWIRRRSLLRVDQSLLLLGGFYLCVLASFAFFECFPVNHRPVLIDGVLEASYPSSTTMLVLCVMPTAAMQLRMRVKGAALRRLICVFFTVFTLFMLGARFLCGVHWLTDIIAGILLSAGLVMAYVSFLP